MCNHLRLKALLPAFILALSFSLTAQPSIVVGKTVFKNACAQCHAKNMTAAVTGPALKGSEDRWADYPREELYAWVRNSQKLIASGHPYAVELWNQYKPTVMTENNLTDDEIESVFLYVTDVLNGPAIVGALGLTHQDVKKSNNWLYAILVIALLFLVFLLARAINHLSEIKAAKDGVPHQRQSTLKSIFSPSVISILIFGLVVLAGYTTVNNAIGLGRQVGYTPDQPVKFSHQTHAGIHKIDCQYCHDGARRSKHAIIPSANTCMNCHRAITSGSTYGTGELTKIYASIGFDPEKNKYVDDYDDWSTDDIKDMYTTWIAKNYLADNGLDDLDDEGEDHVASQWDGIVDALTNNQKKKIQGPIEWTRIHNLPDHVYFNHSQHVAVGKLECQRCHGKVEDMEVLGQHAPLSMGWCINCHRETEVKFGDNEYYNSYVNYHDQMKTGERDKVTVEDIGGLECQKCHY